MVPVKSNLTVGDELGPMESVSMSRYHFQPYEGVKSKRYGDPLPSIYVPSFEKFDPRTTNSESYQGRTGLPARPKIAEVAMIHNVGEQDHNTNYRVDYRSHGVNMCAAKAYAIAQQQQKPAASIAAQWTKTFIFLKNFWSNKTLTNRQVCRQLILNEWRKTSAWTEINWAESILVFFVSFETRPSIYLIPFLADSQWWLILLLPISHWLSLFYYSLSLSLPSTSSMIVEKRSVSPRRWMRRIGWCRCLPCKAPVGRVAIIRTALLCAIQRNERANVSDIEWRACWSVPVLCRLSLSFLSSHRPCSFASRTPEVSLFLPETSSSRTRIATLLNRVVHWLVIISPLCTCPRRMWTVDQRREKEERSGVDVMFILQSLRIINYLEESVSGTERREDKGGDDDDD